MLGDEEKENEEIRISDANKPEMNAANDDNDNAANNDIVSNAANNDSINNNNNDDDEEIEPENENEKKEKEKGHPAVIHVKAGKVKGKGRLRISKGIWYVDTKKRRNRCRTRGKDLLELVCIFFFACVFFCHIVTVICFCLCVFLFCHICDDDLKNKHKKHTQ